MKDLYLDAATRELAFKALVALFSQHGVTRLYHKALAANDNSKNQPYFGTDTSLLQLLPTGDSTVETSTSRRYGKETKSARIKSPMKFYWMTPSGVACLAPNAQIITYPQYPELRFSGFGLGASSRPSTLMDPRKRGREEGRHLFLGVTGEKVLGFLVPSDARLASEIAEQRIVGLVGTLNEIEFLEGSSEERLLSSLKELRQAGCSMSCKLKSGRIVPYSGQNAAGYTLEAKLGIEPNSDAAPDYLGWELKTHRYNENGKTGSSVSTLMTPEPNLGFYAERGVAEFVLNYGYPDKRGRPDRMNFGGVHRFGIQHATTGLRLSVIGFDAEKSLMTDASDGHVGLYDLENNLVLGWSFVKLVDHWKRKHNMTAYVPMYECARADGKGFVPGSTVNLGKGTRTEYFLKAVCEGSVYYDPGIKLENVSRPDRSHKARSQIRVSNKNLEVLYNKFEIREIT